MILDAFAQEELTTLKEKDLYRKLRLNESDQGPVITLDGKDALNFCSNNYLGLANDPRLAEASINCLKQYGAGSGASRLVCGNMISHCLLEKALSDFKGTEECLLFSTGYMANIGIISALFDKNDMIFWDRLNHASIIDGILLSGAKHKRYPHNDMEALEKMIKESPSAKKKAIITDSVFSMDGDIAPLDTIVKIAKKYYCIVMVDEAHALGVIGKNGKGLVEHFHVEKEVDIQMGTLSKAVGAFGAYCCGSKKLIDYLINHARSFVYTTALPPSVAAMAQEGLKIIQNEPERRVTLWENTNYLKLELKGLGFNTMYSQTPIIPILIGDASLAVKFSKILLDEGVFVSAIRPPTVSPNSSRLRMTVMATHTKEQLDFALDCFSRIGKKLCLI